MKKQLVVLSKQNNKLILANPDNGCNSCSSKGVCGVGVLSKFSYKTITKKDEGEQVGDLIELEINNKEIFKNIFLLYFLPIIALFFGSYFAEIYYPHSALIQFIAALSFFIITILLLLIKKV